MKSRIQWVLWVLMVVAVGCQGEDPLKRERQRQEAKRIEHEGMLKAQQRAVALREQLKRGLQPVVDCALERFRKEVEYKYGASAVKQAKVTAEAARAKKWDDEKKTFDHVWEVPIRYVGKDENGKDVDEQWLATVDLAMDSLYCITLEKKER